MYITAPLRVKFMFFDFRCTSCDTVREHFVQSDADVACSECGEECKRLISAPRIALSGKDPDFPRAWAKWEKTRRQKATIDEKFHADHGTHKKHHSYGS